MSTTDQNQPTPAPAPAPGSRRPGPGTLLFRGSLLAIALACVLFAAFLFIPDGNDYGKASALKQKRLHSLAGPKIVLIGGSNLAFGIDSPLIESIAGCPAVNMGMNGYLGVRYMLSEAEAGLRSGDVAVIAFEYDSFVKSVEGSNTDLLMIAKSNPDALHHMTPVQKLRALTGVPVAVQGKIDRLADTFAQGFYDTVFALGNPVNNVTPGWVSIVDIERFSGFTRHGDLTSHLDIAWPKDREDGLDLTTLPVDPQLMPMLREFAARMQDKGVDVLFSYTPAINYYYDRHRDAIQAIDAMVRRELNGLAQVPSRPDAFVYDPSDFFDTVYHVDREGREARSQLLAHDIAGRETASTQCRGNSTSRQGDS